jgi:hypothetical protein
MRLFLSKRGKPAATGSHLRQLDAGFHEQNVRFHESSRKTGFKTPKPAPTQPERIPAASADH